MDECGTHFGRHRSTATRQEASGCSCGTSRNRGKNTTLASSMSLKRMGPSLSGGSSEHSSEYSRLGIEKVLVPSLKEGQVVVMDKPLRPQAKTHQGVDRAAWVQLVYLPSYSADYNPIEEAVAKIKNLLCARQFS